MKTTSTILFALFLFLFNASPILAQDDNDNYSNKEITTNSINYNGTLHYNFFELVDAEDNDIFYTQKIPTTITINDSVIIVDTKYQDIKIFYRCDWIYNEYIDGELYSQLGDNENPVNLFSNVYGYQFDFICFDEQLINDINNNVISFQMEYVKLHSYRLVFRTVTKQYTCEPITNVAWYENCLTEDRMLFFDKKAMYYH